MDSLFYSIRIRTHSQTHTRPYRLPISSSHLGYPSSSAIHYTIICRFICSFACHCLYCPLLLFATSAAALSKIIKTKMGKKTSRRQLATSPFNLESCC